MIYELRELIKVKLALQVSSVLVILLSSAVVFFLHYFFIPDDILAQILGWAFTIFDISLTFVSGQAIISEINKVNEAIEELEKKSREMEKEQDSK
jgi:hypothetical protein